MEILMSRAILLNFHSIGGSIDRRPMMLSFFIERQSLKSPFLYFNISTSYVSLRYRFS